VNFNGTSRCQHPSLAGYNAVLDEKDRQVFKKRLSNDLPTVMEALAPFKADFEAVVVESTYQKVNGEPSYREPLHPDLPTLVDACFHTDPVLLISRGRFRHHIRPLVGGAGGCVFFPGAGPSRRDAAGSST
jgi:hypothetical protein